MNPNIARYGEKTQIKKGQKLPGAGRPKSIWSKLRESTTGKDDIINLMDFVYSLTLQEYLDYQNGEIPKRVKDAFGEDIPIAFDILIKAMLKDQKNGELNNLNSILDRVYGKATQSIEQSGSVNITFNSELEQG